MPEITRRSFLAGIGAVAVSLAFRRQLDAVLDSLELEFAAEPQYPGQLPSAVDIVVSPQMAFRPQRFVVWSPSASSFVIEDILIDKYSHVNAACPLPAEMFSVDMIDSEMRLSSAAPGMEIRFRVRYVGDDPLGCRFQAALLGKVAANDPGAPMMAILPVDSGLPILPGPVLPHRFAARLG